MKPYSMPLFAAVGIALLLWGCSASTPSGSGAKLSSAAKDSLARLKTQDSLRIQKLLATAEFPYLKGSKWSGVLPVANPTEVPDPDRDYKLLFEFTAKNPDSNASKINRSLDEIVRILNLHVASGIPGKRITPVVLIHGRGIEAVMNNESYKKRHAVDNPNLQVVHDLLNVGTKFIVCGQAMAFFDMVKEELLPDIKVTLTAQTVLSNYQLQGYVLYTIDPDR